MLEKVKVWFKELTDTQRYILFGGGAALVGMSIYLARRGSGVENIEESSFESGLEFLPDPNLVSLRDISVEPISGIDYLSNISDTIPAIAFRWNDEIKDYEFYVLNFTPRRAADVPNESETEYLASVQRSFNNAASYICNEDMESLQALGLIPVGFNFAHSAFNFSNNKLNHFMIGYSDPYMMKTNRDDIRVITPVWGVSFGSAFDTTFLPGPSYTQNEINQIYDCSARMLHAEFMLSRGNSGCSVNIGKQECAFEKTLLMNCMLNQWALRKEKINPAIRLDSIFLGPGLRWNPSNEFMSSFNSPLDSKQKINFEKFINKEFWGMPTMGYSVTNFIHPYSMAKFSKKTGERLTENPDWIKQTTSRFSTYPAQYPIRIGQAIGADNSRTFR